MSRYTMPSHYPNMKNNWRVKLEKEHEKQLQAMRNFHREKNALKRGRAILNQNLTNNAVKGLLKLNTSKTRKSKRHTRKRRATRRR